MAIKLLCPKCNTYKPFHLDWKTEQAAPGGRDGAPRVMFVVECEECGFNAWVTMAYIQMDLGGI